MKHTKNCLCNMENFEVKDGNLFLNNNIICRCKLEDGLGSWYGDGELYIAQFFKDDLSENYKFEIFEDEKSIEIKIIKK